ncbi:PTS sugar transporter subunit IIB [Thermophilibacter immobilis]|jgi:fructoselysine and glucoselysine-specific PTS system IIB component|uniref:PTS sugar transporter subunit IIB n=1 Tax=Thermophilibacter immobilis TaxID=2779519 RepID=A0A7S7RTF5_9ACTN|nr:PTS sugar transporter subunit IIB [Thermophilibacter immobilis]QOY60151.1 PTS sugar transporter subunit IIB [Thermophilibacter immobilis]
MIKLCRVDHRLLHGQVAFSWSHALGVDAILVASDAAAADPIRMKAMRLAKPVGMKLVIKSIADSIAAIKSGATDKYKLLIVVGSVADATRLVKTCGISSLNLGGTEKNKSTTKSLGIAVHLSDEERKIIRQLIRDGIEVEVRQVAKDKKVVLAEEDL